MNEYEIVQHPQIDGITLFFDNLTYRTPHIHREWELLWVVRGTLAVHSGGAQYRIDPGRMAVLAPLQPHELWAGPEGCTFLCLQVSPQLLTRFFPAAGRVRLDTPEVAPHLSGPEYEALKQALRQAARAYLEQPPFYQLCCAGQICLVWHTFFSRLPCRVLTAEEDAKAKKRSARLTRLLEFVDNNYMHPIRLADFAQAEGCTMNYMSYFVRQCLDQSFQEYVETVRFDHACKLIDAGAVRMTDVCFAAGFSDYRYFCRAFRRRLGLTPEEYCRRAQPALQPETPVRPSADSTERFYSRRESLELLKQL